MLTLPLDWFEEWAGIRVFFNRRYECLNLGNIFLLNWISCCICSCLLLL